MLEAKGKFWGEKFDRTWNPRWDGTRSMRPIVNCGIMKTEMADANRCPHVVHAHKAKPRVRRHCEAEKVAACPCWRRGSEDALGPAQCLRRRGKWYV